MCSFALRLIGLCDVVFGYRNDRFGGYGSVLDVHEKELQISSAPESALPELKLTPLVASTTALQIVYLTAQVPSIIITICECVALVVHLWIKLSVGPYNGHDP